MTAREETGTRETGQAAVAPARRKLKTVRDMVLSMVVICAGAFALYVFIPGEDSVAEPRSVEYEVAASTAARVAPFDVLVPRGLPDEWRATSVRYEPQSDFGPTWRLGFVDPDDHYAALAQSDGSADGFVSSLTHQAEDTGETTRVGGEEWARYEGPKYDALVRTEPGGTTIVYGTAPFGSLERFAASLQPR
ncbi:DUF4245 domain-containing protein [Streptomyces sp. 7-21]|jgi:hypothetical protein|nr:DUF4245 domain-containing protein [Streptomyces sp. 7-21]